MKKLALRLGQAVRTLAAQVQKVVNPQGMMGSTSILEMTPQTPEQAVMLANLNLQDLQMKVAEEMKAQRKQSLLKPKVLSQRIPKNKPPLQRKSYVGRGK